MVALGFLLIGGFFVLSLLKALMALMGVDWNKDNFSAKTVINHFKWPLISFVAFVVFVMWIVPMVEG